MRNGISTKRVDRVDKIVFGVLVCGGIPFFFFRGVWSELLLKEYLLTTLLLFVLMSSYRQSINEIWFWKAMIPILLVHSGIAVGVGMLNFEFPQIDRLPRLAYGALASVLGMELLAFVRIIEAFRPKRE